LATCRRTRQVANVPPHGFRPLLARGIAALLLLQPILDANDRAVAVSACPR